MKVFGTLVSFLVGLLFLSSCKDEVITTTTYHRLTPFYLSVGDLRKQVISLDKPRELSAPGKIYIFGDYLFINELAKGIHVINNSNPASPRFLNFINIPGNIDLAVNNNILYADSYIDLLAFDISNPTNVSLVKRVEDVFDNQYIDKAKGKIIGYKDTLVTETRINQVQDIRRESMLFFDSKVSTSAGGGQNYGTGGSMARFTLMNNNLYTVTANSLKLFNVSAPREPIYVSTINLGGGIETIFPYQNKLFIGSTTGMHIYDAIEPSKPVKLSTYQHLTSCDPVVVQGKYAYVTLRSGNFCRFGINVLEVLDIQDPTKPVLVSTFPMLNPHGLSISGNSLFVCEGKNGLKAFDSTDPATVGKNQLSFLQNINAADVIAGPKSLIVTGINGIYQYNYSKASDLKLLSHLNLSAN